MSYYSPPLEAYIASVVAVGGDWPSRVQHLRNTYPGNESGFRQALEKAVLAAHEKAKQAAVGSVSTAAASSSSSQHQPHSQSLSSSSNHQQHPDANGQTRSFPGGRSYPGQQQAPVQSPNISTNAPTNHQQSASGMSYIPYARDTAPQARPSSSSYSSTSRRQGQPLSSRDQQQQQQQHSGSGSTSMNMNSGSSTLGSSIPTRPGAMPRPTHSALNPTAIRPPKVQPIPVTSTREPLPPYFPISTSQAYMTTYPSRVKLGLTSLIQPISSSGQVISANPRAITSTASRRALQAESSSATANNNNTTITTLGKRQRAKVDYTERLRVIGGREESSDDDDDDGDNSSDDIDDNEIREDKKLSRNQRAAKRSGISTPRDSPAPDNYYNNNNSKKRKEKNRDDIGGGGRTWLGQDPPGNLILVQPAQRHILPYVPEHALERKAQEKSLLVPIRIELDTETHRIRDSFTWNPHEKFITPEIFAKIFCLDVDIPHETYGVQIAQLIKQQLDEHSGVAEVSLLAPEQEEAGQEADLRVILNLDVQIGTLHLIDRIEWDLTSPLTPEIFAMQMCSDLGLGGEGIMIISHAIHEELLRLKKDCIELGLVGGLGSDSNSSKGPKKLESIWRDWNEAKHFIPHLEILSPEDIDALEFEKEKNPRRIFSRRNYAAATSNTTNTTTSARDRGNRRR